jgi:hypothetical protein
VLDAQPVFLFRPFIPPLPRSNVSVNAFFCGGQEMGCGASNQVAPSPAPIAVSPRPGPPTANGTASVKSPSKESPVSGRTDDNEGNVQPSAGITLAPPSSAGTTAVGSSSISPSNSEGKPSGAGMPQPLLPHLSVALESPDEEKTGVASPSGGHLLLPNKTSSQPTSPSTLFPITPSDSAGLASQWGAARRVTVGAAAAAATTAAMNNPGPPPGYPGGERVVADLLKEYGESMSILSITEPAELRQIKARCVKNPLSQKWIDVLNRCTELWTHPEVHIRFPEGVWQHYASEKDPDWIDDIGPLAVDCLNGYITAVYHMVARQNPSVPLAAAKLASPSSGASSSSSSSSNSSGGGSSSGFVPSKQFESLVHATLARRLPGSGYMDHIQCAVYYLLRVRNNFDLLRACVLACLITSRVCLLVCACVCKRVRM